MLHHNNRGLILIKMWDFIPYRQFFSNLNKDRPFMMIYRIIFRFYKTVRNRHFLERVQNQFQNLFRTGFLMIVMFYSPIEDNICLTIFIISTWFIPRTKDFCHDQMTWQIPSPSFKLHDTSHCVGHFDVMISNG